MTGCHGCQELLLDHLYGLLDEAEGKTLRDHLADCPTCLSALEQARAHQRLLASAARHPFPAVRFAAPAEAGPRTILLPVRPRLAAPRRRWGGWAAAAAVLLALGGLTVPAYRAQQGYDQARDRVARHDQEFAEATRKIDEAGKKVEEIHREINARELRLVVTGPRTVQSGAPAEFQVRTVDLNGQPADVALSASLDRGDAPGASKGKGAAKDGFTDKAAESELTVSTESPGVYRVRIPPTVRLQPGQSLGMLVSARKRGGAGASEAVELSGQVRLTAPVFLTHLTTDKPMYQPGEAVRFRSLTLDRLTLRPPAEDFALNATVTTPTGAVRTVLQGRTSLVRLDDKDAPHPVLGTDGAPVRGVGAGEWLIEADAPGGEYTLTMNEQAGRFPPVSRKFIVNRFQKPRLDKKIDFNRSSYGPGDEVQVRAKATLAGGGAVRNTPVRATVTVDDMTYDAAGQRSAAPLLATTDEAGSVLVRFRLPRQIERGAASLAVTFADGATETIVRPIPLVLAKLEVEFFPEGGELVAGLPNRVYFHARTPLGKPAQVRGVLLEDGKPLPVAVETLSDDAQPGVNQGNGVFAFTPRAGSAYALRIDAPAGIAEKKPLPAVRPDGVVLRVEKGVFDADDPIRVRVASTKPRSLLVGAYCRGEVLATAPLGRGQTEATLNPSSGAGGVCRVTVFEEVPTGRTQRLLRPVAERLVYRTPRGRIDVSIAPDRRPYLPGQKVNLSLVATDEKEKLTPAIVLLGVVDRSVVNLADVKTDRGMPTYFLLGPDVRRADDLEYADFLLGPQAKASQALDLLLGTQGWRRFAEQDPDRFRQRFHREAERLPEIERLRQEEEGERLLVMIGQSRPERTDFDQDRIDEAVAAHAAAVRVVEEADDEGDYKAAVATLTRFDRQLHEVRRVALPALVALMVLMAVVAIVRRTEVRWAYLATTFGLLLLVVSLTPSRLPAPAADQEPRMVAELRVPLFAHEDGRPGGGDADKKGEKADQPAPMAPMPAMAGGLGGMGAPGAPMPQAARSRGLAKPGMAVTGLRGGGRMQADGVRKALEQDQYRLMEGAAQNKEQARGFADLQARFKRQLDEARMPAFGGRPADRLARNFGPAGADAKKSLARRVAFEPPLVVREYAHVHPTTPGVRDDFAETVYWHPALVLADGKANVSFDLSDSVTTFEATAYAHTLDGRLGSTVRRIDSRLPFSLAPKVPVEVTAGDRIDMPVAVSNTTADPLAVRLEVAGHEGFDLLSAKAADPLSLAPESRGRRLFSFRPSGKAGTASVSFEGRAGAFADSIREGVRVVPDGFPTQGASSDLLEASATHKVKIPAWIPGTLACRVEVYPSTLADLQRGLEGLLREPNGCFEQSSTTNYPNVLILDYLRSSGKPDPELENRVRGLLGRGYQKLTSFECQEPGANKRRGYEWFGGTAAPHEALTAYGLLQFRDMSRVYPVEAEMLERTRRYLMAQKDGKGGFARNARAIDTFGRAPQAITNAYIVWALTEGSATDDVGRELDALAKQAQTSDDAYFLSLVAISLGNRGRSAEAEKLMGKVAAQQKADGGLVAKQTSITGSGGRDLAIETTALALLGWLKASPAKFDPAIRKAVKWVGQQRGGAGGFGSTQSTILALKALIAHAKANKRTPEAGVLRLFVGDEMVASRNFPAGVEGVLRLGVPDAEKKLVAGLNTLRVEITGAKNHFPHTLSWECRTTLPPSADKVPVRMTTTLARTGLKEGEAVRLRVRLANDSGSNQGMAVAIVGLPGGLIVPEDLKQLKDACKVPTDGSRPTLGAFEIKGRELVLYWRDLEKGQVIDLPVDLIARVPGAYRGPASRAYLYYNADRKHWVAPLAVEISTER